MAKLNVIYLLDETGSMSDCFQETLSGMNEYLDMLKRDPQHDYRMTLVTFNSITGVNKRFRMKPVKAVKPLMAMPHSPMANSEWRGQVYHPAGMTPLYDAIGMMMDDHRNIDGKVLFVIHTDGLENQSREYTRENIAARMKQLNDRGWAFVFLGADMDAWGASRDMGIGTSRRNTVSFKKDDTVETMSAMYMATRGYAGGQSMGDNVTQDMSEDGEKYEGT